MAPPSRTCPSRTCPSRRSRLPPLAAAALAAAAIGLAACSRDDDPGGAPPKAEVAVDIAPEPEAPPHPAAPSRSPQAAQDPAESASPATPPATPPAAPPPAARGLTRAIAPVALTRSSRPAPRGAGTAEGAAKPVQSAFGLHLASYRKAENAKAGWRKLRSAHADLLRGLQRRLVPFDAGPAKGRYVRLLAAGFADRAAARAACEALRRRGLYCVPRPLDAASPQVADRPPPQSGGGGEP